MILVFLLSRLLRNILALYSRSLNTMSCDFWIASRAVWLWSLLKELLWYLERALCSLRADFLISCKVSLGIMPSRSVSGLFTMFSYGFELSTTGALLYKSWLLLWLRLPFPEVRLEMRLWVEWLKCLYMLRVLAVCGSPKLEWLKQHRIFLGWLNPNLSRLFISCFDFFLSCWLLTYISFILSLILMSASFCWWSLSLSQHSSGIPGLSCQSLILNLFFKSVIQRSLWKA